MADKSDTEVNSVSISTEAGQIATETAETADVDRVDILYGVEDTPAFHLCFIFGLQVCINKKVIKVTIPHTNNITSAVIHEQSSFHTPTRSGSPLPHPNYFQYKMAHSDLRWWLKTAIVVIVSTQTWAVYTRTLFPRSPALQLRYPYALPSDW
jgi:hypothetical protein